MTLVVLHTCCHSCLGLHPHLRGEMGGGEVQDAPLSSQVLSLPLLPAVSDCAAGVTATEVPLLQQWASFTTESTSHSPEHLSASPQQAQHR